MLKKLRAHQTQQTVSFPWHSFQFDPVARVTGKDFQKNVYIPLHHLLSVSVPKNILKELHRHRGRLGANRTKKKKKKKKKRKNDKGEVVGGQRGKVTRLTTTGQQDSDTTSPSGALSESQSTQVLETYLQTSIKASAGTCTRYFGWGR